jgi:lipid-binding SYLF domain-containing protein
LTYSRARGAFAGITLNGAVIKQNQDDTRAFYGRMVPFRTLLLGDLQPVPAEASNWTKSLMKYSAATPAPTATEVPAPKK